MAAKKEVKNTKSRDQAKRNPPKRSALYTLASWIGYVVGFSLKFSYRVVGCLFCALVMVMYTTRMPE